MQNLQDLPRFDNIGDTDLRAANRGAILANIYEDYLECYQTTAVQSLKEYFYDYLRGLAPLEKDFAMRKMLHHLLKRGINFES